MKNPTIKWAQRSNLIYLTLEVGDMKVEELSVVDDSFKIRSVLLCLLSSPFNISNHCLVFQWDQRTDRLQGRLATLCQAEVG